MAAPLLTLTRASCNDFIFNTNLTAQVCPPVDTVETAKWLSGFLFFFIFPFFPLFFPCLFKMADLTLPSFWSFVYLSSIWDQDQTPLLTRMTSGHPSTGEKLDSRLRTLALVVHGMRL